MGGFVKMDRRTAKYLSENFWNMTDEQFSFKECKECGSQYLEEVGHYCGDSVNLKLHDVKEGDVVEPITILPPDPDVELENALNDMFRR